MDVNTTASAAAAANYEPANTGKTGKTGKQEAAYTAHSYTPKGKESSITPEDTLEISEAAQNSKHIKGKHGNWKNFDMDAFQKGIRSKLMESMNQSGAQGAGGVAKYSGDSILYDISGLDGVEAAKVPEYWNAENTAQRIFDFAMSFRELAPELSDEEYVKQIRAAVEKGFGLAKKDLGDLPGPSAKLYNDTYNITMSKFDEWLEQAKAKNANVADVNAGQA
jgi:anti-sigma28 factor (negative regulator of flagellin synthesis)